MTDKFKCEYIIWEDHVGGDRGWTSLEEISQEPDEGTKVHSVGYIIREGERSITICSNITYESHRAESNGVMEMTILKSTILSRKKIKT